MNHRKPLIADRRRRLSASALAVLPALLAGTAQAGTVDLAQGWNAEYKLLLNYGISVRTQDPSAALIDGGTNPSTGYPAAVNSDDGDRNFDQWSPINNRLSTLAEVDFNHGAYGVFTSGSAFYDFAYRQRNDNDSPATVNKTGDHDEFTESTRFYDGRRARLLDAYAYGRWDLPHAMHLSVRAGQQVVSWGESLFFLGISSAQNPADGTKSNVPGVEIKDILLPTPQISMQFDLTPKIGLLGYYKFKYQASELPPEGDFFSSTDIVGPGARFLYVLQNPLYPVFGPNPAVGGAVVVPGTPAALTATRGDDIEPGDGGQFGVGFNYQLTPITSASLYYLHYSENLPNVQINYGAATLVPGVAFADQTALQQAVATGFLMATQQLPPEIAAQYAPMFLATGISATAPVSYNVKYFDDVSLIGTSFSTSVGPAQVAGEYSYRRNASTLVNPAAPTATRADVSQAMVSALFAAGPAAVWDSLTVASEVGWVHLHGADAAGGSDELVRSQDSCAYSVLADFSYNDVISGWDGGIRTSFAHLLKGTPALTSAFGALSGENDRRAGLGVSLTRLQRLELGLSYNWFLGSPSLRNRPLADRDYAAFTIKYGL